MIGKEIFVGKKNNHHNYKISLENGHGFAEILRNLESG